MTTPNAARSVKPRLLLGGAIATEVAATLSLRAAVDHPALVVLAYFVIAYLAISIPIVAVGSAAEAWTLTTARVLFAAVFAVVSIGNLIGLRSRPMDAI